MGMEHINSIECLPCRCVALMKETSDYLRVHSLEQTVKEIESVMEHDSGFRFYVVVMGNRLPASCPYHPTQPTETAADL